MPRRLRPSLAAACFILTGLFVVTSLSAVAQTVGGHVGETADEPVDAQLSGGWPDAVDRLVTAKTNAKGCARRLKTVASPGDPAWREGERLYSAARADVNGVIAGLRVLLSEGGDPPKEGRLADKLKRGATEAQAFCAHVNSLAERTEGEKNLRRALVENLPAVVLEALSTLVDFRNDDPFRRQTILAQLEDAVWQDFQTITPISG